MLFSPYPWMEQERLCRRSRILMIPSKGYFCAQRIKSIRLSSVLLEIAQKAIEPSQGRLPCSAIGGVESARPLPHPIVKPPSSLLSTIVRLSRDRQGIQFYWGSGRNAGSLSALKGQLFPIVLLILLRYSFQLFYLVLLKERIHVIVLLFLFFIHSSAHLIQEEGDSTYVCLKGTDSCNSRCNIEKE